MESPPSSGASGAARKPKPIDGLRLIAIFKFVKAVLLVVTGFGVRLLLNEDLLERLRSWIAQLTDTFEQRLLLHALTVVEGIDPKKIHLVIAVTFAYTVVVLLEGTGLWLRRAWAEWLTVIATASLIPFELWELLTRPPGRRIAVLVTLLINIGVCAYLVILLRHAAKSRKDAH